MVIDFGKDLYLDKGKYIPYAYCKEKVDRYIQHQINLKRISLAIMYEDDIAGEIILKDIKEHKCATLSISLKNLKYKDHGIGTQAEKLAIEYAFQILDIPTLYADTIQTNTRSQHVLEKTGFTLVNEDKDFKYYRIHRDPTIQRDEGIRMQKRTVMLLSFIMLLIILCGCSEAKSVVHYELADIHPVDGRQGVCVEGGNYWVSGSGTLAKYDSNWNLVAENTEPFDGYTLEVNHIGDIDVYNNELYLGVEYFMDGEGKNIQVAIYDGDTLELKKVFPFRPDTGQLECSGIAVDSVSRTVYMTSWIDDESSEYLYMYDLDTGDYTGKMKMQPSPKWLQGIACYEGNLYVTSDDGDADDNAPDHMYRVDISESRETGTISLEKTFDDVTKQGEIEGLTFDKDCGQFLLLYNRGAKIIAGMPMGFYEGYSEEIHEVYVYDIDVRL